MKRIIIITIVLTIGIGIGVAGDKAVQKLKFPWAGQEWNKQADITKLELACEHNEFAAKEPIPAKFANGAKQCFNITGVLAKPTASGINIVVSVAVVDAKAVSAENIRCAINHGSSLWDKQEPCKIKNLQYRVVLKSGNKTLGTSDGAGKIQTVLDAK